MVLNWAKGMRVNHFVTIFVLFAMVQQGYAQAIDDGYSVGTWSGFKSAAVSYTFDDNTPNQLDVAVPLFNEFDFNLTLFTIIDVNWAAVDWERLQAAANEGHEIASHTMSHTSFGDLSGEEQEEELVKSRDSIQANISGQSALTLAYPFCVAGNDNLVSKYYIAARGCQGNAASSSPSNMMNITSIIIGSESSVQTTEDLNDRVDAALNNSGWTIFLAHAIDGEGGYSPVSSEAIRGNLEFLAENESIFWVESFVNVSKYIRERDEVSVTQLSVGEDTITLEVTDTLDNEIYDYPISIRREIPLGWESATATQGDSTLAVLLAEEGGKKYIQFDVVPDQGDILLQKSNATGLELRDREGPEQPYFIRNYPNPFNPSTNIAYVVTEAGPVKLELFDALGKKLATLVDKQKQPGRYKISWDASRYVSGSYIYRLQTKEQTASGMMILVK